MKNRSPLINPTINDFKDQDIDNGEELEINQSIKPVPGQIQLDLDNPSFAAQQIGATKMKLKQRAVILEFSSLWRNPAVPFALTSSILTSLILLIGGILEFGRIPPKIPFFYNSVLNRWEQFDKALIFAFPLVLFILEIIIMNMTISLFSHDKKLSVSISWIIVFLNIILLVAIGQIYTLIT